MYDEDYIAIDVWNTQTGEWFNVTEADSVEEAREWIHRRQSQEDYCDSTYSVYAVKREVIKPALYRQ